MSSTAHPIVLTEKEDFALGLLEYFRVRIPLPLATLAYLRLGSERQVPYLREGGVSLRLRALRSPLPPLPTSPSSGLPECFDRLLGLHLLGDSIAFRRGRACPCVLSFLSNSGLSTLALALSMNFSHYTVEELAACMPRVFQYLDQVSFAKTRARLTAYAASFDDPVALVLRVHAMAIEGYSLEALDIEARIQALRP